MLASATSCCYHSRTSKLPLSEAFAANRDVLAPLILGDGSEEFTSFADLENPGQLATTITVGHDSYDSISATGYLCTDAINGSGSLIAIDPSLSIMLHREKGAPLGAEIRFAQFGLSEVYLANDGRVPLDIGHALLRPASLQMGRMKGHFDELDTWAYPLGQRERHVTVRSAATMVTALAATMRASA